MSTAEVPPSSDDGARPSRALRLTADAGNSRLKLVLWEDERVRARLDLARAEESPAALAGWLGGLRADGTLGPGRAVAAVALSSVRGDEDTADLRVALADASGAAVHLHPDPGVENTCRHPETVGLDRLYAARGALELAREGCVVLDAGTALTVDAAVVVDGRRRFLGGAIAPGPGLLSDALARGGARLHAVEPRCGVPALGRETREALESGVVHGFRGAAAELARRVGLEAGLARAPRVVSGGAAGLLLEPDPFWPGELRHAPDLVHRGLRLALEASTGLPGASPARGAGTP